METQSLENVFARSWQLLTRNWIIIVPGIVVGLIVGIVQDVALPAQTYAVDPATTGEAVSAGIAALARGLIASVVSIAGFVITECYTVGMAGAAWKRGTTALADGATALRDDASNVLGAAVILFVLGVIAVSLALFTLGISLLVFYLFMLYAMPSAVVGGRGGFDAISFLGGLLALVFAFAPLLGPIVAAIISQIVIAFSSLVVVGEYLNLRGSSEPPPIG